MLSLSRPPWRYRIEAAARRASNRRRRCRSRACRLCPAQGADLVARKPVSHRKRRVCTAFEAPQSVTVSAGPDHTAAALAQHYHRAVEDTPAGNSLRASSPRISVRPAGEPVHKRPRESSIASKTMRRPTGHGRVRRESAVVHPAETFARGHQQVAVTRLVDGKDLIAGQAVAGGEHLEAARHRKGRHPAS